MDWIGTEWDGGRGGGMSEWMGCEWNEWMGESVNGLN